MAEDESFEETLELLKQQYLSGMPERIKVLEKTLKLGKTKKIPKESLEDARVLAHQLKGTGATYGFPDISEAGLMLQEEIDVNQDTRPDKIKSYTEKLIKACKQAKLEKKKTPAATKAKTKTQTNTKKPSTAKSKKKKPLLLAADDDKELLALIVRLFEKDAEIITAADGKEALKMLKEHKPDLMILDDIMPKMTGLKLLDKVEKTDLLDNTQIIMLTGSIGSRNIMRAVTKGATDYITKPFEPEELAVKVRALLKQQSKTILIVDDDEAIRDLLEHKFRSKGFKVLLAEDGFEGLEKAEAELPNLVILDRMMPGLNGSAVLQKLRANKKTKDIPVLFLTARRMEQDIVEGFQQGAADYIVKPFITEEVVARSVRLIEDNPGET